MITSTNTEQRIVAAMKKGAKLIYHYYYHGYDSYSSLVKVTLEHDEKSIVLSHWQDDPGGDRPGAEEINGHLVYDVARAVVCRGDVKEAYPGYQSDYAKRWRKVWEHCSAPVPQWVTEQWGWDEDGQRM